MVVTTFPVATATITVWTTSPAKRPVFSTMETSSPVQGPTPITESTSLTQRAPSTTERTTPRTVETVSPASSTPSCTSATGSQPSWVVCRQCRLYVCKIFKSYRLKTALHRWNVPVPITPNKMQRRRRRSAQKNTEPNPEACGLEYTTNSAWVDKDLFPAGLPRLRANEPSARYRLHHVCFDSSDAAQVLPT